MWTLATSCRFCSRLLFKNLFLPRTTFGPSGSTRSENYRESGSKRTTEEPKLMGPAPKRVRLVDHLDQRMSSYDDARLVVDERLPIKFLFLSSHFPIYSPGTPWMKLPSRTRKSSTSLTRWRWSVWKGEEQQCPQRTKSSLFSPRRSKLSNVHCPWSLLCPIILLFQIITIRNSRCPPKPLWSSRFVRFEMSWTRPSTLHSWH